MTGSWTIVGTSKATPVERDVSAFRLDGDVSTLIVPLAWPIPKRLEQYLKFNGPDQILILWQALAAQSEFPDKAGYVPFPDLDDLPDVYFRADGQPIDAYPWDRPGNSDFAVPTNWQMMLRNWYMEQDYYGQRELAQAFSDAMEAQTGIPLEQSAPSLYSFLQKEVSGGAASESKPASTTTKTRTAPKSGRRRTTSSPAA